MDGAGGVRWRFHADGFIVDDDDAFFIVIVLACVHKLAPKTPRVPVNNHTAACSGVASVPLNWRPPPSPTREFILTYERGDDWAMLCNWNWKSEAVRRPFPTFFFNVGHFENDCFTSGRVVPLARGLFWGSSYFENRGYLQ